MKLFSDIPECSPVGYAMTVVSPPFENVYSFNVMIESMLVFSGISCVMGRIFVALSANNSTTTVAVYTASKETGSQCILVTIGYSESYPPWKRSSDEPDLAEQSDLTSTVKRVIETQKRRVEHIFETLQSLREVTRVIDAIHATFAILPCRGRYRDNINLFRSNFPSLHESSSALSYWGSVKSQKPLCHCSALG